MVTLNIMTFICYMCHHGDTMYVMFGSCLFLPTVLEHISLFYWWPSIPHTQQLYRLKPCESAYTDAIATIWMGQS